MGGMGIFMPAMITACNDDPTDPTAKAGFNFSSDRGALNLAYAYSQFMADFYARVAAGRYVGATTTETSALNTISTHKSSHHRTGLSNLITSGRVTDAILYNFSIVDFSSRASVFGFLQTFEDLGVAAINGCIHTVDDPANVKLLGQIVSVWARHAAVVRDLNDLSAGLTTTRNSFASSANAQGLDPATAPGDVVTNIQPYHRTTLSVSGL
jgi:hypothetical protein